jgi:acetylornithine deacetylase/succinyl-diaminopimelate desuccinylase-like protein
VALVLLVRPSLAEPPPPTESEKRVQREARRLLTQLVAVETVAANETRAVGPIAEHLRKNGIPAQILESAPGRGNLIARVKGNGSKRPLLLLAHVDVVPVAGQTWTVRPFQLTEKDGYLYGRGVNDDKGMAAAIVAIAVEAKKAPKPLSRDLIVALTAGEETGGFSGAGWLVKPSRTPGCGDLAERGQRGGVTLADDLSRVVESASGSGRSGTRAIA